MATSTSTSSDEAVFKGQCFCGAITFTVHADKPGIAYLCHCLDCQRLTGTAFAWNAWFDASDLEVTVDADKARAAWKTGDRAVDRSKNNNNNNYNHNNDDDDDDGGDERKQQKMLITFGNDAEGKIQFCGGCGVRLFLTCQEKMEMTKGKVIIPVGVIEGGFEDQRLRPSSEAWVKRKVCWLRDVDLGLKEMRGRE